MPSHHEALEEQRRLFPNGEELPGICGLLRSGVNGAADEWHATDVHATLAMLKERVDTWAPSVQWKAKRVDAAIKRLVEATIKEVESYAPFMGEEKKKTCRSTAC